MKVLQINSVAGFGSTGRIVEDIQDMLEEKGHECYIAYGRNESNPRGNVIKIGSQLDIYWHAVVTRLFDRHGFGSKRATRKLIKQIEAYKPDIIHLHNIHGYYINVEILFNYLKKSNKPVIWTLHDCWPFTGHCPYFDFVGCDKWLNKCYKCPQRKKYYKSYIIDNSTKNYLDKKKLFNSVENMTLVTPSKWLADVTKQSFIGQYPIKVINNGIDLSVFHPLNSDFRKEHNLEDKKVLLGVANPWHERKGLQVFLELSKMLDDSYKIVLVGLNDNQLSSLPKEILGFSRTNSIEELVEIYSTADFVLNPSVEETMGLVTVEAIACGTPAIVSNLTAVPEMVTDKCGVVVKKATAEEFYKEIINNRAEDFKKEDCIKHAESFDKKLKYQQYFKLYEEVYSEMDTTNK